MEEHRARREAAEAASAGLGAEKREEDLVDVLLSVKEKGGLEFPLTETNIKAVLLDMFSGGTSTVSGTLGWTMAELMRHPEVMKKAQSEVRRILKRRERIEEEDLRPLNYTKQVMQEALRLAPAFPG
ncbi:cytochrome P450 CYP71D313-like isoform X2 [Asparagus officinalis]|nr:cytochrome P450 CYP71D313-like isoform X2 [Asparagus officinalis]